MKTRYLIALILTVVLLVVARTMSTRHDETFKAESSGVTLAHETVTEDFGQGPKLEISSSETAKVRAIVLYSETAGGPYQSLEMESRQGGFTATLPVMEKGKKWFYHIEVYKDNIKLATFPPERDQFIKFKGHISSIILIPHILLMFGTIFFGLMAVFTSIDVARGKGDARRSVIFLLLTFTCAFIGGIPLGIAVSQQTFGGSGWGGWPLGDDVTDTKTEVLLLFWLVTILLSMRALSGRKMAIPHGAYSFLVILSFVVTFVTFLIPHSL